MPQDAYWLDQISDGTFSVETDTGSTDYVAGVQSVAISGGVNIERLFTADSIKIEEQKQSEATVNVEVGVSLWDYEFVREWLGGDGSASDTLTDTSDPQKFTLNVVTDSTGGDRTVDITVTGITFEEMPVLDASRGEFVEWSPSGTGEDMTVSVTDNTV